MDNLDFFRSLMSIHGSHGSSISYLANGPCLEIEVLSLILGSTQLDRTGSKLRGSIFQEIGG